MVNLLSAEELDPATEACAGRSKINRITPVILTRRSAIYLV
jgi:hypothetical protein